MSEAERKRSSLREQLSRAKGALANSLGISATARATKRAAAESKQRLSDVLWNDRTLAASRAAASDHPTTPVASQAAPAAPPAPPAAAPPLQMPSPHTARARVATPSSPRPPVPAGAFAPPRQRRPSPPPPSAAGMVAPVPEMVLSDLETLVAADERAPTAPAGARTQPPTPPPARKPPPPPPARVARIPQPSAAAAAPQPPLDQPPSDQLAAVAAPSAEPAETVTPSIEPTLDQSPAAPSVEPKPAAAPSPAVAAAPVEDDDEDSGWQEPICTRSMARLLAGQGHRDRALAIYDVLLRQDAADASLRAEAEALRAR